MTFWAEVFLGVIALATFTMAAIQVGVIVYGWTLARRVNRLLAQVERDMKPLAENLNAIARDAARISGLAAGQVERVDRLVTDLASRLEQTATTVQDAILRPLREGAADPGWRQIRHRRRFASWPDVLAPAAHVPKRKTRCSLVRRFA